jgi:hypothetical protein
LRLTTPILVKVSNKKKSLVMVENLWFNKPTLAILAPSGQTYTVNNSTAAVLLNNIQKTIEAFRNTWNAREGIDKKTKRPYRVQR